MYRDRKLIFIVTYLHTARCTITRRTLTATIIHGRHSTFAARMFGVIVTRAFGLWAFSVSDYSNNDTDGPATRRISQTSDRRGMTVVATAFRKSKSSASETMRVLRGIDRESGFIPAFWSPFDLNFRSFDLNLRRRTQKIEVAGWRSARVADVITTLPSFSLFLFPVSFTFAARRFTS